jgi:hypothetical protein
MLPTEILGTLVTIHRQLANTGVLYMLACGVWGLWMAWRRQPMDANYRGVLTVGYILGLAIGAPGGLLYLGSALKPSDPVHILYGLLLVITLPMAVHYSRNYVARKPLIYGLVSLFTMGLMMRGILTATR